MEILGKVKKENLIILLEKFQESGNKLNDFWTDNAGDIDDVLDADYPFEMSFDELSFEIDRWTESSKERLSKKTGYEFYYEDSFGRRTVEIIASTHEEAELIFDKKLIEIRENSVRMI
jgi:hypothetical protein